MPSNVIDQESQKHTIQPYRFKILRQQGGSTALEDEAEQVMLQNQQRDTQSISKESIEEGEKILEEAIEQTPLPEPEPEPQQVVQPSFIEELLKRTEEANDNLIKLQMKIESQESEFKERLAADTAKAKEEGIQEGIQNAKATYDAQLVEINSKYSGSIKKLEEECAKLEEFLQKTEEQLSHTALDIAKEVVNKELSENSALVATSIAKSLIAELKDASKIEIKVNPADLEFLSANIKKLPNMKITSDDAISKGGALVLSDVSNMDGDIKSRFEKIKKILSE